MHVLDLLTLITFLGESSERYKEDLLKITILDEFIHRNNNNRKDLTGYLCALIQNASQPLSNWSHSRWHWNIRLCGFHIEDYPLVISASWPRDSWGKSNLTNRHAPKHQSPTEVQIAQPLGLDSTQSNIPISVMWLSFISKEENSLHKSSR